MGVSYLLSTLQNSRCVDYFDLVKEARDQRGGIEIICDFDNFKYRIIREFWKSTSRYMRNDYIELLGGEYKLLDEYFIKLITDMQSLNIFLVMVLDAAPGSSKEELLAKMQTMKRRHNEKASRLAKLVRVIEWEADTCSIPHIDGFLPVLLEVQILETLRQCKCEVIQCSVGESDYVIAKTFTERPRAFAIMSNDSDFAIFQNCRFITDEFFDTRNHLKLGVSLLPQKPERLICGVISSRGVAELFKLPDENMLVEMSILAGNDFTRPHLGPAIHSRLGLVEDPSMFSIAAWVAQYKFVDRHPVMRDEMTHNPKLAAAVRSSRQFYTTSSPPEDDALNGELARFIRNEIEAGRYSSVTMAMHQNFYWHRRMLEDYRRREGPSVEQALAPLRSYIYRMLLPRPGDDTVLEYGLMVLDRDPLDPERVQANDDPEIITVDNIRPGNVPFNLSLFARIMRHQEPEYRLDFFDEVYGGPRVGFQCYCLRYLLRLCTGDYLNITLEEFKAVFASVFCELDEAWYQKICIIPSVRCLTLASLFQAIYNHAYMYLGKMLYLTKLFPEPKEMFSGAVFTAFYMVNVQPDTLNINEEVSSRILGDCRLVLERQSLQYVLQGIYEHDTVLRIATT